MESTNVYFATLVVGLTYSVSGLTFKENDEQEVAKDLYDYLENNPQFSVRSEDASKVYTADELAAMTKTDLKRVAKTLKIEGYTKMEDTDELIDAIVDAQK